MANIKSVKALTGCTAGLEITKDSSKAVKYQVEYESGSIRYYDVDKAPKTVQSWIDENEKAEKRRAAFEACNRGEDAKTWRDIGDKDVELTEQEMNWFHEVADRCKKATGYDVPIIAFDHENYYGQSKEALGTCRTENCEKPIEGNPLITIDTFFIHEKYRELFEGFPCIEPESMVGCIIHELAHLTVWSHGEEHDRKMQELMTMVEAYEVNQEPKPQSEEPEQATTLAVIKPVHEVVKEQEPLPEHPINVTVSLFAALTLAGLFLAGTAIYTVWWITQALALIEKVFWIVVPKARAWVVWIRTAWVITEPEIVKAVGSVRTRVAESLSFREMILTENGSMGRV